MYLIYSTSVYKVLIDIYLKYPTLVQKALTENYTENTQIKISIKYYLQCICYNTFNVYPYLHY